MSQRLAVAKMLKQDLTYTEIAASTGASTATNQPCKKNVYILVQMVIALFKTFG